MENFSYKFEVPSIFYKKLIRYKKTNAALVGGLRVAQGEGEKKLRGVEEKEVKGGAGKEVKKR